MSTTKHVFSSSPALLAAALLAAPAVHADTSSQRFGGLDYEPMMDVGHDPVRTRVNKFRVETEDGKHRFGIRGRLMTDFAYVQDPFGSTDDEDAVNGQVN